MGTTPQGSCRLIMHYPRGLESSRGLHASNQERVPAYEQGLLAHTHTRV
jgi:hypothetical protein